MTTFTKTDIVNLALIQAGYNTITNFDSDTSEIAKKVRLYYLHVYQLLLCVAPWQFATKRAELTKISLDPNDSPFNYEYQFPSDTLYLWDIYSGKYGEVFSGQDVASYADRYHSLPLAQGAAILTGIGEVSGNRVLSNQSEISAFYTSNEDFSPALFSAMFRDQIVKEIEIMLIRSKDTGADELQIKEQLYSKEKRANLTRSARQNRKAHQVTPSLLVRNVTGRY
jgi:hypothetical protein